MFFIFSVAMALSYPKSAKRPKIINSFTPKPFKKHLFVSSKKLTLPQPYPIKRPLYED
jgi:hypothetical protein